MPDNGAARTERWWYHEGGDGTRNGKISAQERTIGRRGRLRQGDRGLRAPGSSLFFGNEILVTVKSYSNKTVLFSRSLPCERQSHQPRRKSIKGSKATSSSTAVDRDIEDTQRKQQWLRQNACVGTLSILSRSFLQHLSFDCGILTIVEQSNFQSRSRGRGTYPTYGMQRVNARARSH